MAIAMKQLHIRYNFGPLIFQFEYLNRQKMPSQSAFLEKLGELVRKCPRGYSYAIEIRNPNYIDNVYFQFLSTHALQHVFLQGYYLPSIFRIYAEHGHLL